MRRLYTERSYTAWLSLRRFAGDGVLASRDSMVLPLCLLDPDGY